MHSVLAAMSISKITQLFSLYLSFLLSKQTRCNWLDKESKREQQDADFVASDSIKQVTCKGKINPAALIYTLS